MVKKKYLLDISLSDISTKMSGFEEKKTPSAPAAVERKNKNKVFKTGMARAYAGDDDNDNTTACEFVNLKEEIPINLVNEIKSPPDSENFVSVIGKTDDAYLSAIEKLGIPVIRNPNNFYGNRVISGEIGFLIRRGQLSVVGKGVYSTKFKLRTDWAHTSKLSKKEIKFMNLTILNISKNEAVYIQDENHVILPLGPGRYVMKEPYKKFSPIVNTLIMKSGEQFFEQKGERISSVSFVKIPIGSVGLFRKGKIICEKTPGEYAVFNQGVEFLGNSNIQEHGRSLDTITVYTKDPTPVYIDVYLRVQLDQPKILRGRTRYIDLVDALEEIVALKLKDTIGALTRDKLQNPTEIAEFDGKSISDYLKAISISELSEFSKSVGGNLLSIGFRVHYDKSYQDAMHNQAIKTLQIETKLKNARSVANHKKIEAMGNMDSFLLTEKAKIKANSEKVINEAKAHAEAEKTRIQTHSEKTINDAKAQARAIEIISEAKIKAKINEIKYVSEAELEETKKKASLYKGIDPNVLKFILTENMGLLDVEKIKQITDKTTATFVPENFRSNMTPFDLSTLKKAKK